MRDVFECVDHKSRVDTVVVVGQTACVINETELERRALLTRRLEIAAVQLRTRAFASECPKHLPSAAPDIDDDTRVGDVVDQEAGLEPGEVSSSDVDNVALVAKQFGHLLERPPKRQR